MKCSVTGQGASLPLPRKRTKYMPPTPTEKQGREKETWAWLLSAISPCQVWLAPSGFNGSSSLFCQFFLKELTSRLFLTHTLIPSPLSTLIIPASPHFHMEWQGCREPPPVQEELSVTACLHLPCLLPCLLPLLQLQPSWLTETAITQG